MRTGGWTVVQSRDNQTFFSSMVLPVLLVQVARVRRELRNKKKLELLLHLWVIQLSSIQRGRSEPRVVATSGGRSSKGHSSASVYKKCTYQNHRMQKIVTKLIGFDF